MWPLLFGLVTLVAASVWAGVLRHRARWKGVPGTRRAMTWSRSKQATPPPPIDYFFSYGGGKNAARTMQLGIRTRTSLAFDCKPESRVDRFFKWTGLAVEQQLGKAELDEAIYLVSDDRRVLDALNDDPRVQEILASLFCQRPHPDYRALRLVCRGGMLRLDLAEASYLGARLPDMLDRVLPALKELAERLPGRLAKSAGARDWASLRALLVLALSTGLAIHGGAHLFRLLLFSGATTLEPSRLLAWVLPAGAALLGLMVVATLVLLARSSRLHLVMLEVVLVGLFGAFSTAFVEVRDLNMALDRSQPVVMSATVVRKYSSKSRRSPRRYFLVLSDWPVAGRRRARVDRYTYGSVQEGDPVRLRIRDGWLQVPWLERIEKAAPR